MQSYRTAILLVVVLGLAGCVETGATRPSDVSDSPRPPADPVFDAPTMAGSNGGLASAGAVSFADPPVGCFPDRPVVVHKAGGIAADRFPGPRPSACYHDTGFESWEPTIGILSDGTVFIGPGVVDFPDVFLTGGEIVELGVLRSRDQGQSWDLVFPDVAGVSTHQATLDPYLYVDPGTDRVWLEDLSHAVNIAINSWSDDAGETWMHAYAGGVQTDHVSVFAGPPATTATVGYPNVVHRCGMGLFATNVASFAVLCQRSVTGGSTWLPPGEPAYVHGPGAAGAVSPVGDVESCRGGNGHGFVTSTGRVYLPRGHCGQPFLAWSDDEGLTWDRAQVSDLGIGCDAPLDPPLIPPTCADGPGVAMDSSGTLFYAWVAADRLAYLASSHDGGETWTDPLAVTVPGATEVSHLKLAAGGVGRIAIVYYATPNGPTSPWTSGYEETVWNVYLAYSLDADRPDPTFATLIMNDPRDPMVRHECGQLRCDGAGDFIDIRVAPDGSPWAVVVDACVDECVDDNTHENNGAAVAAVRLWNVRLWDHDAKGPYA